MGTLIFKELLSPNKMTSINGGELTNSNISTLHYQKYSYTQIPIIDFSNFSSKLLFGIQNYHFSFISKFSYININFLRKI